MPAPGPQGRAGRTGGGGPGRRRGRLTDAAGHRGAGGWEPVDHGTVLCIGARRQRPGARCRAPVDGRVSAYHLGQVCLGAVDGATGRPAPNGGRTKKTWPQLTPSSLAALKAARGLRRDCVSGRCGASAGVSCWRHRSAWNACWQGLYGAAGIKAWPNIGKTSDAQFHNYNCSTRLHCI